MSSVVFAKLPATDPIRVETLFIESTYPGDSCRTLHRTISSSLDVWQCEPGEFEWQADIDQSSWVIEGSAEIQFADGRVVDLCPGMAVFFPQGLHGHWVVKETLKTVTARGS
jgi:uncharacterized cupin superfamily protein